MPKIRDFHLSHLPFKFDVSKNLNLIYGLRVTRDLISKMAIFFLPIFLYQQGSSHDFWHFLPGNQLQRGVLLLVIYYLIKRLTTLITAIEIGKLTTKVGYQKSMLLGFASFGLFLSLLYASTNPGWLILISAAINGLETNFFWSSYQTLISEFTLTSHLGQDLGLQHFLLQVAQAIAPALSGFLIMAFGFHALFMIGLVGVLVCVLLTLNLDLKKNRDRVSWKELRRWFQDKSFARLALSQGGRYLNDATLIFWPLYVFLLLGAVDKVGFLYTASLFLAMILSFSIGFYIDHQQNKKPFYLSGGFLSILWLLRSQVVSFWQVVIIDTFDRLTSSFYTLFADSILVKRGKGSQSFSYYVYREIIISLTAVIFWLAVGGLFFIFDSAWTALFAVAAVGVLLGLLAQEHRHGAS